MGAAVWQLRRRLDADRPWVLTSAAVALWPGIAIGEAAHGIVRISSSTPVGYWIAEIVVALGVVTALSVRALHTGMSRAVALGLTALVAAALFVAYGTLLA